MPRPVRDRHVTARREPPWWIRDIVIVVTIGSILLVAQARLDDQRSEHELRLSDRQAQQDRRIADTRAQLDQRLENLRFVREQAGTANGFREFSGLDLQDAPLSGLRFVNADLKRTVLRGADLSGANLYGAMLEDADVRDADLSGADLHGAWIDSTRLDRADLTDIDGRELSGHGASLDGAYLMGAYMGRSDLDGASLRYAYLFGALLRGVNLRNADFRGAYLRQTNFQGARLEGANFEGACYDANTGWPKSFRPPSPSDCSYWDVHRFLFDMLAPDLGLFRIIACQSATDYLPCEPASHYYYYGAL